MVGSAGRHTDRRRLLALPGAAVSHGVLPVMAWEGPGSRPRGTAPRTTDATVPLWRKNASAEGRDAWEGRAVAARWSMASRHGAAWHVVYEGSWGPRARRAPGSRGSDTQRAIVRERGEHAAGSTAIEMSRAMDMAFWLPETDAALVQVDA